MEQTRNVLQNEIEAAKRRLQKTADERKRAEIVGYIKGLNVGLYVDSQVTAVTELPY